MKKQLAIAIVAILLTTVLIASPVMAFGLWDGNSVQYSSSHWSEGYNSITDESVTASNQSIDIGNGIGERESSSWLKYYRAPVPVRTYNWPAILMGTGIREERGISGNSAYGIRRNTEDFFGRITEYYIPDSFPPVERIEPSDDYVLDESDHSVVEGEAPGCRLMNLTEVLAFLNGTKTLAP
jgi:hypothetical protein